MAVEHAFRACSTDLLGVQPAFVRNEKSTRGHGFVVMLAYRIIRHLRESWQRFDVTVEEGLKQLATLPSIEVKIRGKGSCFDTLWVNYSNDGCWLGSFFKEMREGGK